MNMLKLETLGSRRAVEALRSGVPNRDAVDFLGCGQPQVERRFRQLLDSAGAADAPESHLPGLLIEGGFGAGKSHVLEYLGHLALSRNFVCSKVVISKETPFYDLSKVFLAAVGGAQVPHLSGPAIQEIAARLDTRSDLHGEFYRWVTNPESRMSSLFGATLYLHEHLRNDPDLVDAITNFWAGERLSVQRIKQGLKQVGATHLFKIKPVPVKELGLQRFRFAAHLIRAAGYRGWVILFDEMELIGRYSLLQRGRSYAEFARWMGKTNESCCPGIVVVSAITDDFVKVVLDDKGDSREIAPRLREKASEESIRLAKHAEAGMRAIEREAILLDPLDSDVLTRLHETLREVHSQAYGWKAPPLEERRDGLARPVRAHIRRWIHGWDLRRLYPESTPEIEEREVRVSYTEESDLEEPEGPEPSSQD